MNCQFATLEQDALLHITGPDSLKFLQGQTSCDTRTVDSNHAQPGVYCTPQGRVVCDFLLCELDPGHFALRLRRDIRAHSSAVFGKYIIFSKAELDDSREDWKTVAVWGPAATGELEALFGTLPRARFGALAGEGFVLVQTDDRGEQFECMLHDSVLAHYLSGMGQSMQPGIESSWQALQISSGHARIEAVTTGEFVPQVLNYDLTGHISFKKGCYTGQEVVARLHYRGKPKRRTYLAELPAEIPCTVGASVFSAASGSDVGSIVNCATAGEKTLVLVSAVIEEADKGLRLNNADGAALTLGKLPYALGSS